MKTKKNYSILCLFLIKLLELNENDIILSSTKDEYNDCGNFSLNNNYGNEYLYKMYVKSKKSLQYFLNLSQQNCKNNANKYYQFCK